MIVDKILNPYSLPPEFRAYAYDSIVLSHESKRVSINTSKFNQESLMTACGLNVLKLESLEELQIHDSGPLPPGEFLFFFKRKGDEYAILLKRLRDTFAHGHYESTKRDWITIRHRYKERGEKVENTRAFGNFKITTLKRLVAFLDVASSDAR